MSATKLGNRQCQCAPTGHFRHTTTGNLRKYFEKCALVCKFTGKVGEAVFDFLAEYFAKHAKCQWNTFVEWLVRADCARSDARAVWHVRCYAFAASQGSGVGCRIIAVVSGL